MPRNRSPSLYTVTFFSSDMLADLLNTLVFLLVLIPVSGDKQTNQPPPSAGSPRILLVNPIRGSHLFFMLEIGKALAGGGYNVTLVNLDPDSRVALPSDPLFRLITPSNSSFVFDVESHKKCEVCVKALAEDYPADQGMAMSVLLPICRDMVLEMYSKSLYFFHSPEWEELQKENNFRLIVAEERTVWAAALGSWGSGVPIAMVNPELSYILPKVKHHLPLLFNSEPGLLNIRFEENHGILTKIWSIWSAIQLLPFAIHLDKLFKPFLNEHNLTSLDQVTKKIELFFVNDYPSFSFPYLLPPTVVNIGTLGYSSLSELPPYLTEFLTKDSDRTQKDSGTIPKGFQRTIYLSFGSYVASDLDYFEKYSLFIEAAKILQLKIVISLGSEAKTFAQIFLSGNLFEFVKLAIQLSNCEFITLPSDNFMTFRCIN